MGTCQYINCMTTLNQFQVPKKKGEKIQRKRFQSDKAECKRHMLDTVTSYWCNKLRHI